MPPEYRPRSAARHPGAAHEPLGARHRALNEVLAGGAQSAADRASRCERFGTTFRAGDKVMQIRNNYDKEVFNGDIGHISAIELRAREGDRGLRQPACVAYEPGELDELQPAYAITIHKSQGSEFPCVIIPLASSQFIMLERSLIYTAVTRGKRLVVIVGEEQGAGNRRAQRPDEDKMDGVEGEALGAGGH